MRITVSLGLDDGDEGQTFQIGGVTLSAFHALAVFDVDPSGNLTLHAECDRSGSQDTPAT